MSRPMLMIILWVVCAIIGLVALLMLGFWIRGRAIPVEHQASSTVDLPVTAEEVFALLDDVQAQPSWNKSVNRVDMLPDRSGMQACRMKMGRNSFVLVRTRREPPHVLERTISDDHGPFSGTWLYTLTPSPAGCRLKLTETGRVTNSVARAMMKHLFGYHMYINAHLKALGKKFGHEVTPHKA